MREEYNLIRNYANVIVRLSLTRNARCCVKVTTIISLGVVQAYGSGGCGYRYNHFTRQGAFKQVHGYEH